MNRNINDILEDKRRIKRWNRLFQRMAENNELTFERVVLSESPWNTLTSPSRWPEGMGDTIYDNQTEKTA